MREVTLTERAGAVKEKTRNWKAQYDVTASQLSEKRDSLSAMNEKIETRNSVASLLKAFSAAEADQSKGLIESVITQGLLFIFEQDYAFKMTNTTIRNAPVVEFMVLKNGKERPPLGSVGGGIVDVCSFLLRVCVVLLTPGRSRIIVLDEPAKMLSADYVPRLAEFMAKLSEEFSVQFIMVTHNPELSSLGNAYRVHNDGETHVEPIQA